MQIDSGAGPHTKSIRINWMFIQNGIKHPLRIDGERLDRHHADGGDYGQPDGANLFSGLLKDDAVTTGITLESLFTTAIAGPGNCQQLLLAFMSGKMVGYVPTC